MIGRGIELTGSNHNFSDFLLFGRIFCANALEMDSGNSTFLKLDVNLCSWRDGGNEILIHVPQAWVCGQIKILGQTTKSSLEIEDDLLVSLWSLKLHLLMTNL